VDTFLWCSGLVVFIALDLYQANTANLWKNILALSFKVVQHYYITRRSQENVGASLSISNFLTALIDAYYTHGS
jgi:hypothetical protein